MASRAFSLVIPAQAGIQESELKPASLDSRLRGNDEEMPSYG
jgi:hypothetical protein